MALKRYSEEAKAQVMAALLAGQGVSEVARQYKISKATVSRLRSKLGSEQLQQIGSKRADEFSELLATYLREILTTQTIQIRTVFRDEAWLKKQSADALATLHGVITDKAIRLLEAADFSADESQPIPGDDEPGPLDATPGTPDSGISQ